MLPTTINDHPCRRLRTVVTDAADIHHSAYCV